MKRFEGKGRGRVKGAGRYRNREKREGGWGRKEFRILDERGSGKEGGFLGFVGMRVWERRGDTNLERIYRRGWGMTVLSRIL